MEHRFAPFDMAPKRVVLAGRPAAKYRVVMRVKVRQAVIGQAGGGLGQQPVDTVRRFSQTGLRYLVAINSSTSEGGREFHSCF